MEEILKALAPWPLLEGLVLGMMVAAAGVWAMRRGLQENRRKERTFLDEPQLVRLQPTDGEAFLVRVKLNDEELKAQWKFYEQMDHLHENTQAIVKHMEKMVEIELMVVAALNRFVDVRWNKNQ